MKKDRTLEIQYYDWRLIAWFTSETRERLDDSGRGIYRELLDHCYAQGTFPDDKGWICRKCASTPKKLSAAWAIIEKHFPKTRDETHRHNVLADIFRKRTLGYIGKQSEARLLAIAKAREKKEIEKVALKLASRELQGSPNQRREGNEGNEGKVREGNERNEGEHAPNGAPQLPPLNSQTEYPLTIAAIRKHDAAVDEFFVLRLVQSCSQHCLSHPKFPKDALVHVNDKVIAKACAESYATGPAKHGTGLLLNRVPPILVSWALED